MKTQLEKNLRSANKRRQIRAAAELLSGVEQREKDREHGGA